MRALLALRLITYLLVCAGVGALALALGAVTLLAGRRRRVTRPAPETPEAGAGGPRPVS